ncbi:hypothetical protein FRC08_015214 [Ceratobasidium sp. 394]|nr:hypothetical protein FRC08_015214 [Ceratobasidium sp. 394]
MLDGNLWEIRPSELDASQPLFWSKTGLGSGDHQLTIRHVGSPGQFIALDNFHIDSNPKSPLSSSGPSAPNVVGTTLIVDKTDPGLVYSGNWTALTAGIYGAFYEGDAVQTQTAESSVTFRFNGTAVWYYADIFQDFSGGTRITVDGSPAEMVYAFSNHSLLQHMVWSRTGLSQGEHTVLVEHIRSDTSYTSLNFFRYAPGEITIPTSGKSVPNATTVVACAIGAVVLIALLFLIGVSYRRKRTVRVRCSPTPDLIGSMHDDYAPITPYQAHFPVPVKPSSGHAAHSDATRTSDQGQTREKHLAVPEPARVPPVTRSANRLHLPRGDVRSFLSMGSVVSHVSVSPLNDLPPYVR